MVSIKSRPSRARTKKNSLSHSMEEGLLTGYTDGVCFIIGCNLKLEQRDMSSADHEQL